MPQTMKIACPRCGSKSARAETVREYRYRESGLANVVLSGGVTRVSCPQCKRKYVSIHNETQLLQVLALALLSRPGCLPGPELRFLRQTCELTQAHLAKLLGRERYQTILEWEAEADPKREPGTEILLRLVLLHAFREMLDKEGNNHLSPPHIELLLKFQQAFAASFMRFLEGSRRGTLALKKADDEPWLLPPQPSLQPLTVKS